MCLAIWELGLGPVISHPPSSWVSKDYSSNSTIWVLLYGDASWVISVDMGLPARCLPNVWSEVDAVDR